MAGLCDGQTGGQVEPSDEDVDAFAERRAADLVAYQNQAYADRYLALVERARDVEATQCGGKSELARAVARYAYKLMAYKDEYEVARLHSDPAFKQKLDAQFEGNYKLRFNLAPPLLARKDKVTGKPRKMEFGSWLFPAFGILAKLKFLRGTIFDIFGYTVERKTERQLIVNYEKTIAELLESLGDHNHELAVQIASIPEQIRGYGYVKEDYLEKARTCEQDLLNSWRDQTEKERAA